MVGRVFAGLSRGDFVLVPVSSDSVSLFSPAWFEGVELFSSPFCLFLLSIVWLALFSIVGFVSVLSLFSFWREVELAKEFSAGTVGKGRLGGVCIEGEVWREAEKGEVGGEVNGEVRGDIGEPIDDSDFSFGLSILIDFRSMLRGS